MDYIYYIINILIIDFLCGNYFYKYRFVSDINKSYNIKVYYIE